MIVQENETPWVDPAIGTSALHAYTPLNNSAVA